MTALAAAAVLVFGVRAAVLAPLAAREALLTAQVQQQQHAAADIDKTIAEQASAAAIDPDKPLRERLAIVQADTDRLAVRLRAMQGGLVAPERMAPLLEAILRANGRLKLVSMKTLPVAPLSSVLKEAAPAKPAAPAPTPASVAQPGKEAEKAAVPAPPEPELLYRHGVELTVRGNYLDLVDYMTTLESLPTQLFWGKAHLEVENYPAVRLTLTLYTMSLDDQWMKF
jgi:MSHA biogenesis protein MshJ